MQLDPNLNSYLRGIEGLDLEQSSYKLIDSIDSKQNEKSLSIIGDISANQIFLKSTNKARLKIRIDKNSSGNRIFIGSNVTGDLSIRIKGNNSTIYIGNDCSFANLEIKSLQNDDLIFIGNNVTNSGHNLWVSGNGSGDAIKGIVISDDCMFGSEVLLRSADGHPIYNLSTDKQINQPEDFILIEPHVWVGDHVKILKSVTIGACSIVALGSIVTKNIARFTVAKGIPAEGKENKEFYWSRNYSKKSKDIAKYYVEKYKTK